MKRKGLYIFILLLLAALTGCGRKAVEYEEANVTDSGEDTAEEADGGALRAALGVGDEQIWEENIQVKDVVIAIEAEVVVPEVSDLYTLEVSQYYYTAEDKQRIAEYFLDKDSIRVDKEKVQTKESISEDIQTCKALLELEANDAYPDEAYMAAVQNEQKWLENLLGEAPEASAITEDVGDYAQDYYRGTKNGIGYSLDFNIAEDKNVSSWVLRAEDGDSFLAEGEKWEGYMAFDNESFPRVDVTENLCDKEKAIEQVEKICDKLGVNMCIAGIYDVHWGVERGFTECNGYRIELSRQLNDVMIDSNIYARSDDKTVYLDAETAKQAYDKESLEIILNDKGIFSIEYYGILSEGKQSGPVKLLGYDQIKEVFRQELKKLEVGVYDITFRGLELNYVRISNPERRDTYTYIPAWRLAQWNEPNTWQTISGNIWINAIDGSRIDMEEEGAIQYETLDIRVERGRLEE